MSIKLPCYYYFTHEKKREIFFEFMIGQSPEQIVPSPEKPLKQLHWKLPMVSSHSALLSQLLKLELEHSSISVNNRAIGHVIHHNRKYVYQNLVQSILMEQSHN